MFNPNMTYLIEGDILNTYKKILNTQLNSTYHDKRDIENTLNLLFEQIRSNAFKTTILQQGEL